MKLTSKLIAIIAAAAAVSSVQAQGLIGENYYSLDSGYLRYEGFDGLQLGASVNMPVSAGVDFGAGYAYGTDLESGVSIRTHTVMAGLRGYYTFADGVKPYAQAGVGYSYGKVRMGGFSESDDDFYWSVGIGTEFVLGQALSVTPSITYLDGFSSGVDREISYGISANYWLSQDWAVSGGFSYGDERGPGHSKTYLLSLIRRF
jgi:opacity protein-like surface antigen